MPVNNSITVTNDVTTVTGYLTQFVAAEGDLLVAEGFTAEIARRESSSILTLKKPWPGPTATDVVRWSLIPTGKFWHSNVNMAQRVMDLIARLEASMPFKPDAFGTFTGRAQYDSQSRGFIYLVIDVDPKVIYIKQSTIAGDWGSPIQIQGNAGPVGPQGPAGAPSNTLAIGTIETLPAGQNAAAVIRGTAPNYILDLGIPIGETGAAGPPGGGAVLLPTVTYSTSRQLTLADANKRVRMNLAANGAVTVPSNANVAFPSDTEIQIFVAGAGDVTITPATGVTIIPAVGLSLTEPGQWMSLRKVGTDTWDAWGGAALSTQTPQPGVTLSPLSLSASTVAENVPAGTIVGAIIGKTPSSTLSLPVDAGGRFAISGSSIVTGTSGLDFEVAASHQITVRETLAGATNSPRDTVLTITVTDVADGGVVTLSPLTLSTNSVTEQLGPGQIIASIVGKTVGSTLTLVNNAGGRVALNAVTLSATATTIDYEQSTTLTFVVRETLAGAGNSPRDTTFTMSVVDINESGLSTLPALQINSAVVDEDALDGTLVAGVTNKTAGSVMTMTQNGGGRFTLVGAAIRTTGTPTFDYSTSSNHIIAITETLGTAGNSPRTTTFRIAVAKVSATPILTALRLQPSSINEGEPNGAIVGTLLDVASGSVLSMVNDAGGRFMVSGNMIRAASVPTDYEAATSHQITVRETLAGAQGSPRDTTFTVSVLDVVEGGVGNDTSPNPIILTSVSGAELSAVATSQVVTLDGVSAPTPISITGGTMSLNGGAYTSSPTTFNNNTTLSVRVNAPATYSSSASATVTYGDKTATFTVTTKASTGTPPVSTIQIEMGPTGGPWKITMPYDASGGLTGTAVEIWPPAVHSLDDQYFDRQPDGSLIFMTPVNGARTSGSSYPRTELREILADGSNEFEWTTETGGRLEATCAVLELPVQTVGTSGERMVIGQIHGPDDEPCRLYFYRSGEVRFYDDKAGAGTAGTETPFTLRNSSGQVSAIPLGEFFTYAIEMDRTGIRASVLYNGVVYTAFSPLSNFWPGKLMYFKAGSYSAIGAVGSSAGQQGTGRNRVHFRRLLRPKHPHTISATAFETSLLAPLTVNPATLPEATAPGVVVGAIQGRSPGSSLTLTNNAGGMFAISGSNIVTGSVATNFDVATSHTLVIRETLAGAANSPRDSTITIAVTNVTPAPVGVTVNVGDSLDAAVQANPTGTTFILKAGVHRMQKTDPKSAMTFIGEEGAILCGAALLTNWTQSGSLWYATGQTQEGVRRGAEFPEDLVVYPRPGYPETCFYDDQPLRHVAAQGQVVPGTFFLDYTADRIYIAQNPAGHKVEAGKLDKAFGGSATNVTIKDLIIEKYNAPAQDAPIQPNAGATGWVIEDCEVRLNYAGGIYTRQGSTIRNCWVHDNGQYGIGGNGGRAGGMLIEFNEINNNGGWSGLDPGWEGGGTKWAETNGMVVRNNYSHHNNGTGLWWDWENFNVLCENNLLVGNADGGIYYEISHTATIRNNVLLDNGSNPGNGMFVWNSAILIQNSDGNTVSGNYVRMHSQYGQGIHILNQNRDIYIAENNTISNNTIVKTGGVGRSGIDDDFNGYALTTAAQNVFSGNKWYMSTENNWNWAGNQNWSQWQAHDAGSTRGEATAAPVPPTVDVPGD